MARKNDGELELELDGEDGDVCNDCVEAERVRYASSVAESVVVFVNRVRAGETKLSKLDITGLAHHFMAVLERRERTCACCCPELYGDAD